MVLIMGGLQIAHGQTFSELFKQKKTQEKYLTRQIAELQGYIALARKGYGIVTDGLGIIGDLKNGRFRLDKDYFSSLSNISSTVRNDQEVTNVILRYNEIRRLCDQLEKIRGSEYLPSAEAKYIQKVRDNLLEKCRDDINELDQLTTPGKYTMTESERLEAIHKIYKAMEDKYDFAGSFYNEVRVLINQRTKEGIETKELRRMYDNADKN